MMVCFADLSKRVLKDEEGATLVEYSLLVGLLAIAGIASVAVVGGLVEGVFETLKSSILASGQPP